MKRRKCNLCKASRIEANMHVIRKSKSRTYWQCNNCNDFKRTHNEDYLILYYQSLKGK